MHRLLVDTETLACASVELAQAAARHLKVLRPKDGERIELFDGKGRSRTYSCPRQANMPLTAVSEVRIAAAPHRGITLFACVTKGSRWDWTIEKAVELGVTCIVPVISARCIVRLDAKERAAKRERWMRVAEDAARQSDAHWLPDILAAVDFDEALRLVKDCVCFAGALMDPPPDPLLKAVQSALQDDSERTLAIFVGPEGDFTPQELAALQEIAVPTSFGSSVLRAETAAIYGVSVLAAAIASSQYGVNT